MIRIWKTIGFIIGMSGLAVNSAHADCVDNILNSSHEPITKAALAKYNQCMTKQMHTIKPPLKLSQSSWVNACVNGKFNENNACFAESPLRNPYTNRVLSVTNIYAIANLSLSTDYSQFSIWIGYYPASDYSTTGPLTIPAPTGGASQVLCAPFTEIGWAVPSTGINTDREGQTEGQITWSSQYVATIKGINSETPVLTMLSGTARTTQTPLYIICVGRTPEFNPADLSPEFTINWK